MNLSQPDKQSEKSTPPNPLRRAARLLLDWIFKEKLGRLLKAFQHPKRELDEPTEN